MKKWIIAFVILLLILPTMLVIAEASLPSIYSESYYAELAPMTERMDRAEGKKLVLIGSSNIAFGTDVGLLEELLAAQGYAYTVCPYGLYAAVGCSAMLSLSEDALGEGDIVVLAIEPTAETMSEYFGATAFLKCTEDAPWLLGRLNGSQRRAALGNYVSYLQERLSILRSGDLPRAEGVYSRAAFGENCNLDYDRPGNIMALGFDSAEPVDLEGLVMEEDFVQQVNDYCRAAAAKGATVYLSFSPVNRSALTDSSQEVLDAFFARCNETFRCTAISDPSRYVLDSAWFYDSNFHLNSAGAKVRTVYLAEDLLAQLGCTAALDYELPKAPKSAYTAPETGNGSVEDVILEPLSSGSGAWLVVGLTEQGLAKEVLELPSSYEGAPVTAFTPDALNGAENLVELRLPETIETIPDDAFAGCPRLTRLVLLHESVPCGVGDLSFDGADQVRVYVPAKAWSLYRDGYGCETNPWAQYLDRVFTY